MADKEKKKSELVVLVDENTAFTLSEICRICGIHAEVVNELMEYSIVEPQVLKQDIIFSIRQLETIRKALRLQHDFNINLPGLALSLDLLETIEELQQKIQKLEFQLSAFHSNL